VKAVTVAFFLGPVRPQSVGLVERALIKRETLPMNHGNRILLVGSKLIKCDLLCGVINPLKDIVLIGAVRV
jgi:hypothetical protein